MLENTEGAIENLQLEKIYKTKKNKTKTQHNTKSKTSSNQFLSPIEQSWKEFKLIGFWNRSDTLLFGTVPTVWYFGKFMENSEKLTTHGTQDEEKQNKNTIYII